MTFKEHYETCIEILNDVLEREEVKTMRFTKEEKYNIILCVKFARNQMEKLLIKEICPVEEIDNMLQRCSDLDILLDKLYKW